MSDVMQGKNVTFTSAVPEGEVIYTIRLPVELREAMQKLADESERKLSDEMRLAMKVHLQMSGKGA